LRNMICRRSLRCSLIALGCCLALRIMVGVPPAASQEAEPGLETDQEYQRMLDEHPEYKAQFEKIDSLLAEDQDLEDSYLAYQESLMVDRTFAAEESTYFEALEEDTVLARRLAEFEATAAEDSGAVAEFATMDSLFAVDPELAERVEELESAAAEDPDLIDNYGEAMAYLEADPEEAEGFFGDEAGPTYHGEDPRMIVYVGYLAAHPRLYRAHWNLYRYLRSHRAVARVVYGHWKWCVTRRPLWEASWRYRLRAARHPGIHRVAWQRRIYLGGRPQLLRHVWHHRLLVAGRPGMRPVLARYSIFAIRHPEHARTVVKHRHWVRKHHPQPKAKPRPRPEPKPKPKPKPPPEPKPKRH
jgi:hypothetical protein